MDQEVGRRMLAVEELAFRDERYRQLLGEYRVLDAQLLRALDTMTKEQRDVVMDYLGLLGEMFRRMPAIACER